MYPCIIGILFFTCHTFFIICSIITDPTDSIMGQDCRVWTDGLPPDLGYYHTQFSFIWPFLDNVDRNELIRSSYGSGGWIFLKFLNLGLSLDANTLKMIESSRSLIEITLRSIPDLDELQRLFAFLLFSPRNIIVNNLGSYRLIAEKAFGSTTLEAIKIVSEHVLNSFHQGPLNVKDWKFEKDGTIHYYVKNESFFLESMLHDQEKLINIISTAIEILLVARKFSILEKLDSKISILDKKKILECTDSLKVAMVIETCIDNLESTMDDIILTLNEKKGLTPMTWYKLRHRNVWSNDFIRIHLFPTWFSINLNMTVKAELLLAVLSQPLILQPYYEIREIDYSYYFTGDTIPSSQQLIDAFEKLHCHMNYSMIIRLLGNFWALGIYQTVRNYILWHILEHINESKYILRLLTIHCPNWILFVASQDNCTLANSRFRFSNFFQIDFTPILSSLTEGKFNLFLNPSIQSDITQLSFVYLLT